MRWCHRGRTNRYPASSAYAYAYAHSYIHADTHTDWAGGYSCAF